MGNLWRCNKSSESGSMRTRRSSIFHWIVAIYAECNWVKKICGRSYGPLRQCGPEFTTPFRPKMGCNFVVHLAAVIGDHQLNRILQLIKRNKNLNKAMLFLCAHSAAKWREISGQVHFLHFMTVRRRIKIFLLRWQRFVQENKKFFLSDGHARLQT